MLSVAVGGLLAAVGRPGCCGLLGLGAGAVVLLPFAGAAAWGRLGGWLTSVGVAVAAASLGLLVVATLPAAITGNLVLNSGFEAGTCPWKFGGGSERVSSTAAVLAPSVDPTDGTWAARQSHSFPGWQVLLRSGEAVRVNKDQAYVVCLIAMLAASGISGTFLRVDTRTRAAPSSPAAGGRPGQRATKAPLEGVADCRFWKRRLNGHALLAVARGSASMPRSRPFPQAPRN